MEHIGERIRDGRKAKGLTQAELAARLGYSERSLREWEAGRVIPDRHSIIDNLARALDCDVAWLVGQPYRGADPEHDIGQSAIPALRTALRRAGLILSGHPSIQPTAPIRPIVELRSEVTTVNRRRQAASLLPAISQLPTLVEALNTIVLESPERGEGYRLQAEIFRAARMVLDQLGAHDLAWVAAECAASAAGRVGDPGQLGAAAWDRCGVMLHTGSHDETQSIASAALSDLEGAPATDELLSIQGALWLRRAIAACRTGDSYDAASYLRQAADFAARLGRDANYFQTMFGPTNVEIHTIEAWVELGESGKALAASDRALPAIAALASNERRVHQQIDRARALLDLGRDGQAVSTLGEASRAAREYVRNHPLARGAVLSLRARGKPAAFTAGLRTLERDIGLTAV